MISLRSPTEMARRRRLLTSRRTELSVWELLHLAGRVLSNPPHLERLPQRDPDGLDDPIDSRWPETAVSKAEGQGFQKSCRNVADAELFLALLDEPRSHVFPNCRARVDHVDGRQRLKPRLPPGEVLRAFGSEVLQVANEGFPRPAPGALRRATCAPGFRPRPWPSCSSNGGSHTDVPPDPRMQRSRFGRPAPRMPFDTK